MVVVVVAGRGSDAPSLDSVYLPPSLRQTLWCYCFDMFGDGFVLISVLLFVNGYSFHVDYNNRSTN